MANAITLRVGICECTSLYHGSLNNHCFYINGQRFRLQEIKIPERQHTKHIRHNRCHFFIDINTYKYRPADIIGYDLWAHLVHYDFLPPTKKGRREQLKIDCHEISTENQRRFDYATKNTIIDTGQPNKPETVLKKIRATVKGLGRHRNAWLSRMARHERQ